MKPAKKDQSVRKIIGLMSNWSLVKIREKMIEMVMKTTRKKGYVSSIHKKKIQYIIRIVNNVKEIRFIF